MSHDMGTGRSDLESTEQIGRIQEVQKHFAAGMMETGETDSFDESDFVDAAMQSFLKALQPYGLTGEQSLEVLAAFRKSRAADHDHQMNATDRRIDEIFRELSLSRSATGLPQNAQTQELLRELRELQEHYAGMIRAAHVEQHLNPLEESREAIQKADDILRQYENPPTADSSAKESD